MDAGSSGLVLEFGTPLTARGQGKDDGSMLHKLPQMIPHGQIVAYIHG